MREMSAVYATPILYINMGGEMLYVLQQRLQTQKINPDKTIQVMSDVIYAMLNPKQLATIFASGPLMGFGQLRPMLERVVLSSIMKLDANSLGKLFDLMIMMVKYQLATASGPREVILSTLNHLDAIRDMAVDKGLEEYVDASHRLVIDTYGQLTHEEIWQIRNECLNEIQDHNVRVSILLRLGRQNQDATFNRLVQRYDEKYQDRKQLLESVKLADYVDEDGTMGLLSLFGDRATLLGKNAYGQTLNCSSSSSSSSPSSRSLNQIATRSNKAMRQELETLATQLGKEDTAPARPFSLHLQLFQRDNEVLSEMDHSGSINGNQADSSREPHQQQQQADFKNDNDRSLNQYKSTLVENVSSEFTDDNICTDAVDLMNLLDIM